MVFHLWCFGHDFKNQCNLLDFIIFYIIINIHIILYKVIDNCCHQYCCWQRGIFLWMLPFLVSVSEYLCHKPTLLKYFFEYTFYFGIILYAQKMNKKRVASSNIHVSYLFLMFTICKWVEWWPAESMSIS